MSARNYVMSFLAMLLIFMAGNVILWNAVTRSYFIGGDLQRMGSFTIYEAKGTDTAFPNKHTEFSDYIKSGIKVSFDVITIGDSFSNGHSRNYYQDYLADKYGLKVLNFHAKNYLEGLYMFIESGLLEEFSPCAMILESVEREVQNRLGVSVITPESIDRNEFIHSILGKSSAKSVRSGYFAPVMVKVNLKYFRDKLYRVFNTGKISRTIYITQLDREMFTNKGQENLLLYYYGDMNFIDYPLNVEMMSRNLANVAAMLKEKGIKLIFFVAPDKYDLYYPYIKDKTDKPENKFFDEMRKIKSEGYTIIDTLSLLRSALARGEKDIYWLDDTHWSYKGMKIVCDEIAKYLRPRN